MNPMTILFLALLLGVIVISTAWLTPLFNKLFSFIWSEEEKPIIKREAQERLNELFVDGDVPEETAAVMTATEENMEERELLEMFRATSPKDLKRIITSKDKGSLIANAIITFDQASRKNMRRR